VSSLSQVQRRAIDLAKEGLVVAAEQLLERAEVRPNDDFGHSQLRNLEAVAAETESPAVLLNFIRYQMGKDQKNKESWARVSAGGRIGDQFIAALNEEGKAVSTALTKIPDLDSNPISRQVARIILMRYFLGFATRYMKYLELKYPKPRKENR
jgi:hypothetical protein